MSGHAEADLIARPYGSTIYLDLPASRLPLRFTKITETGWKRTDGLAGLNTWLSCVELAHLITQGTITNPLAKDTK